MMSVKFMFLIRVVRVRGEPVGPRGCARLLFAVPPAVAHEARALVVHALPVSSARLFGVARQALLPTDTPRSRTGRTAGRTMPPCTGSTRHSCTSLRCRWPRCTPSCTRPHTSCTRRSGRTPRAASRGTCRRFSHVPFFTSLFHSHIAAPVAHPCSSLVHLAHIVHALVLHPRAFRPILACRLRRLPAACLLLLALVVLRLPLADGLCLCVALRLVGDLLAWALCGLHTLSSHLQYPVACLGQSFSVLYSLHFLSHRATVTAGLSSQVHVGSRSEVRRLGVCDAPAPLHALLLVIQVLALQLRVALGGIVVVPPASPAPRRTSSPATRTSSPPCTSPPPRPGPRTPSSSCTSGSTGTTCLRCTPPTSRAKPQFFSTHLSGVIHAHPSSLLHVVSSLCLPQPRLVCALARRGVPHTRAVSFVHFENVWCTTHRFLSSHFSPVQRHRVSASHGSLCFIAWHPTAGFARGHRSHGVPPAHLVPVARNLRGVCERTPSAGTSLQTTRTSSSCPPRTSPGRSAQCRG
eukprot:Sspe_Gene.1701::Locus_568_Transcript_3_4_Confidence_0.167_Length_2842::g.1701::m.1701